MSFEILIILNFIEDYTIFINHFKLINIFDQL